MKHNKTCPACQHTSFFVINPVKSPDYEYSNTFEPIGIAGVYGPTGESGLLGPKKARQVVTLEAWVCQGCGLTSFFANDLELLGQIASKSATIHVERK